VLKIYQKPSLSDAAEIINGGPARCANTVRIGSVPLHVNYTTLETLSRADRKTSFSPIHNTAAPNAIITSMQIWTTWHCPKAIIPIGWFQWLYGLLSKIVCHTVRHHGIYGGIIGFLFRGLQFRTGLKRRGKKAEVAIRTDYIDKALSEFSGYIAADELYDGPFCVLFIVDNHKFNRLYYEVLDHNPTNEDMIAFFRRFKRMLDTRDLTVKGITTDGSPLYPEPIAEVFGDVEHQSCQFHVIKEINKAILKAVAQVRRETKQKKIKRQRGRPSGKQAKRIARKNKRIQDKITSLFEYRYLFVKHTLTHKEKKILQRITRGFEQLRSLRSIVDEVYRLFDRRCRMDTALDKLAKLRRRVGRFTKLRETLKKLWSPNLEKALTFLDDSLLPATSNAVERANRRHRKMQKSIYRVRTRDHISQRIAIDMQRDLCMADQKTTINTLHWSRSGEKRKAG
jgi:hypothetical protein